MKLRKEEAAKPVCNAVLSALLVLLCGCTVGPDYVKPKADTPPAFKEAAGWKVAQPRDEIARGNWWEVFSDTQLSALIEQVAGANQTIAVAQANFQQARALVQGARSAYFPTVGVGAAVTRSTQSSTLGTQPVARGTNTDYLLQGDVTWEVDLWGRVRRSVESNEAAAQASAGDLQTALLSAQAELAANYFLMRTLDAQRQLLDASVVAYQKSLQLTQNRYAAGIASKVDISLAQTLVKTTQAQAIDTGVQRAQLEHAIAVLIGKPPSELSIPPIPLSGEPPLVPAGVPSALLERRPDIAAAERRVAAANAQIGVALAAYYPSLTLSASGGYETTNLSEWLTAPSRFWALGPAALAQTVFDGGLRRAQTQQARAAHEGTVASYRQTVLTAFQEVEDNLAALRILQEEALAQKDAVSAAEESVRLTTNQYKAGTVSYLDVVVSQTAALNNQRTAVDIQGRRMTAAVLLVKALGGGWNAAQMPTPEEMARGESTAPVAPGKASGG
jgi:NodT family efflux transporter outer membrane factor (OMF) lipoprotein